MKLSSGGAVSQTLRSIKQPPKEEGRLVFVYPVLIDSSLEREYGNIVRDFLTAQFISNIKTSNVLNITTHAVNVDMPSNLSNRVINPAEQLSRTLNRLESPNSNGDQQAIANVLNSQAMYQTTRQSKYDYQEEINRFREFIKQQIKIDPMFADTRPVVSSITIENLLNLPLILGTKTYKIDPISLYWILLISVGQEIALDSDTKLEGIKHILRQIPTNSYVNLLYNKQNLVDLNRDQKALSRFINDNNDKIDVAIKRLKNVLNPSYQENEIGYGSQYTVAVTTAFEDSLQQATSQLRRAKTLFTGFLGNDIIRLIQAIIHSVIPPHEADISARLAKLTDVIIDDVELSYNHLLEDIKRNILISGSTEPAEKILSSAEDMCKDNTQIQVNTIFKRLAELRFRLTGSGSDLASFIEDLSEIANVLKSYSKILDEYIVELSGNSSSIGSALDRFKQNSIYSNIKDCFESIDFTGATPIVTTDTTGVINSIQRFARITGANSPDKMRIHLQNSYTSITEIAYFSFVYCFFSYICEYLGYVKADIQVKKQDALSFPNYCMVIPSEYIEKLYFALAAHSFQDLLKENANRNPYLNSFKASEKNIGTMLNALNERLKIPNIIVIDKKTNEIYYKWMFFNPKQYLKLSTTSLQNYTRHQIDILQAF